MSTLNINGQTRQADADPSRPRCNWRCINPKTVEAQVQGGALMGLSMCLPGAAITLKDGVVQQSNFAEFAVPRTTDMPLHELPFKMA